MCVFCRESKCRRESSGKTPRRRPPYLGENVQRQLGVLIELLVPAEEKLNHLTANLLFVVNIHLCQTRSKREVFERNSGGKESASDDSWHRRRTHTVRVREADKGRLVDVQHVSGSVPRIGILAESEVLFRIEGSILHHDRELSDAGRKRKRKKIKK